MWIWDRVVEPVKRKGPSHASGVCKREWSRVADAKCCWHSFLDEGARAGF